MSLANQLLLISYLMVCEIIFCFEFPDIPENSWRRIWKKQAYKCKAFYFSSKRKNWIHAWKPNTFSNKSFDQKNQKVCTLSDSYYQHSSTVHIKQYWSFQRVTGKQYYQLSRFFIIMKHYWHFQRVTCKKYYTLF